MSLIFLIVRRQWKYVLGQRTSLLKRAVWKAIPYICTFLVAAGIKKVEYEIFKNYSTRRVNFAAFGKTLKGYYCCFSMIYLTPYCYLG